MGLALRLMVPRQALFKNNKIAKIDVTILDYFLPI